MDKKDSLHLLRAMIDYFEAGNTETDAAAKNIIESDMAERKFWEKEIEAFRQGTEWTGLRAPEAEILVAALRQIQVMLGALD